MSQTTRDLKVIQGRLLQADDQPWSVMGNTITFSREMNVGGIPLKTPNYAIFPGDAATAHFLGNVRADVEYMLSELFLQRKLEDAVKNYIEATYADIPNIVLVGTEGDEAQRATARRKRQDRLDAFVSLCKAQENVDKWRKEHGRES